MNTLMAPKRLIAGCALAYAMFLVGSAVAASPSDFVDEASAAGVASIETSRMAISKSSAVDIGSYAVEVIKDYTNANRDLKDIAQKEGLKVETHEELLSKAKKLMLQVQEGDSFDVAYAANQLKASEEAVELYKQQIDDPASPELQAFAEKYLPKLEMHVEMAKRLVSAHHKGEEAVLPE
ncbi:DUF4142 domain-containing protein [Pseudomonas sp. 7P_10.2_Bac1]|uniref:DUF4142 domain-containing protein n=1 Tax=Pseudomonas sp. 7P_10.2_Bac1 TaxID=2971614 RepID=UPI0021C8D6AE|nr:DUF4142 domain-containing protein [Pseudomonas sp. 7P_10.2_Bac1]MCU1728615.1 DUF4142 domain-containing protein [Pseudomonas sp. 7P_10.2_Bac1]